ncbi:hypothetical protein KSX_63010 [Ktedonospora formicarum]|uniref:MFS transporter n=2 Tax=Ktedonospora formicarum TaxID=2778364 RepID=A0A8J3I9A8_9CHLR|nr:hypothetical protein KSX_63010 [Ktedonospora formicarum]
MIALQGGLWALFGTVAIGLAPRMFLGSWGGNIIDRYPHHKVMLWASSVQLGQALGLCVLQFTGNLNLWGLYPLILLGNVASMVFGTAQPVYIMRLVPYSLLNNARYINNLTGQLAIALGAVIGGLLSAPGQLGWLFLLNTASFLPFMRVLRHMREGKRARPVQKKEKVKMREALEYLGQKREVRLAVVVYFVVTTCMSGSMLQQLTGYALGGPHAYSLLVTAASIGEFCTALVQSLRGRRRYSNVISLLGWSAWLCFFLMLGRGATSLWLAMFCLAVASVGLNAINIIATELIVNEVPEHIQGRMSAIDMMAANDGMLLNGLLVCLMLQTFKFAGVHTVAIGFTGSGLIFVGLVWVLHPRGLRLALSSTCLLWTLYKFRFRRHK